MILDWAIEKGTEELDLNLDILELPGNLFLEIFDEVAALDLLHKLGFYLKPSRLEVDCKEKEIISEYETREGKERVTVNLVSGEVWTTNVNLYVGKFKSRMRDSDIIEIYLSQLQDFKSQEDYKLGQMLPMYYGYDSIPTIHRIIEEAEDNIMSIILEILNISDLTGDIWYKQGEECLNIMAGEEFVAKIGSEGLLKVNTTFPITNISNLELIRLFWEIMI